MSKETIKSIKDDVSKCVHCRDSKSVCQASDIIQQKYPELIGRCSSNIPCPVCCSYDAAIDIGILNMYVESYDATMVPPVEWLDWVSHQIAYKEESNHTFQQEIYVSAMTRERQWNQQRAKDAIDRLNTILNDDTVNHNDIEIIACFSQIKKCRLWLNMYAARHGGQTTFK